jgi:hypothetical protein
MMNNAINAEIDGAFFDVLSREGFSRLPGELLSYVRSSADGRVRTHVDVEVRDYLSGFGVTMQEVSATGSARRQLLEDFQGIPAYRFDQSRPDTVRDAVARALADLHFYGLAWLAGRPVSTAATDEVRRLTGERRYSDVVQAARDRFKAGDYAEALRLFDEARSVKPLDPVDSKYRVLAEKKTKG